MAQKLFVMSVEKKSTVGTKYVLSVKDQIQTSIFNPC